MEKVAEKHFLNILLEKQRFWLQRNIETVADLGLDARGQGQQLSTAGAAMIDQYQCVSGGDPGITVADALEAQTIDQPCGGQLGSAFASTVGGKARVGGEQGVGLRLRDDWILEKTAGIAEYGGIGEFAAADAADGFADIPCDRRMDAHGREFLANAQVVQDQGRISTKSKAHRGDDPALAARRAFEHAVAIGESARIAVEYVEASTLAIENLDGLDQRRRGRSASCGPS